jgi:hypothetical protein
MRIGIEWPTSIWRLDQEESMRIVIDFPDRHEQEGNPYPFEYDKVEAYVFAAVKRNQENSLEFVPIREMGLDKTDDAKLVNFVNDFARFIEFHFPDTVKPAKFKIGDKVEYLDRY